MRGGGAVCAAAGKRAAASAQIMRMTMLTFVCCLNKAMSKLPPYKVFNSSLTCQLFKSLTWRSEMIVEPSALYSIERQSVSPRLIHSCLLVRLIFTTEDTESTEEEKREGNIKLEIQDFKSIL